MAFLELLMATAVKRGIHKFLRTFGYDIVRFSPNPVNPPSQYFPPDFDDPTRQLIKYVKPYTMTSMERLFSLRQSVEYIVRNNIPGDIVECGVWKGGSMMAVARILIELGAADRSLYLFDTFDGMSAPTAADKQFSGEGAADLLRQEPRETSLIWAYSPLDDVRRAMRDTGYREDKIIFVKGKVEETLPKDAPKEISILRLDTDWYESTYHELIHLYPRLSVGGVLIIDDYGHWEGARRAVDDYVRQQKLPLLLNRIDYSGRICVKPG